MKNNDLPSKTGAADKPASATDAAEPKVRAANEDSPETGALFRLIQRRPSRQIPLAALTASVFLLGAEAAFLWGRYGLDGLQRLGPLETGLIAAAALAPLTLIWMLAFVVWRGQEMRLMADALARTAIRLSDPEDFASGQIATISGAVRRELGEMRDGLDAALARATELKEIIAREVEEIDRGSGRAEFRTRTMEELIGRHRASLEEVARTLGSESDAISRAIREQVDAVRGLTGKAADDLRAAGDAVSEQAEHLGRVSEAARAGADQTASMLDRQSSRLEVVASDALSKADEIGQRYEQQRAIIAEAADRLVAERERFDTSFESHRATMETADATLAHHTAEIGKAVASLGSGIEVTFDTAAARAAALRDMIAGEIRNAAAEAESASTAVSRSAGAATRAIGATVDELKAATGALSTDVARSAAEAIDRTTEKVKTATVSMSEEVMRVTQALTGEVAGRTGELRGLIEATAAESDNAAERFNAAMMRLGGTAREAGRVLHEATDDLAGRIDSLPDEAAQSAAALADVLKEQISALATIAEIVVRHARTLDRSEPLREAPARVAAPQPPRPAEPARRWGLSDLLAAAEQRPAPTEAPGTGERDFQRASLHVVETLQALAIDLDAALEQSPPAELWQRYQAGERNVFTRRLYNMAGRDLYDRIAAKYRKDAEFRGHVDRFTATFENLLGAAAARDRDNILVETYLTSDTGKVYLMLGQATGKLG
ncbi:hypothetical protein [uncultured Parvibaculum sp.]|uniref:hypothetical protein n=1 Tax=uncultured Parvibaculum sp. TaxID=291828 RepID=UPI0030DC1C9B|tara:strand:- start:41257 stop:43425 length:2169 start_codon:yes stop_codon:yes gene_type:complete